MSFKRELTDGKLAQHLINKNKIKWYLHGFVSGGRLLGAFIGACTTPASQHDLHFSPSRGLNSNKFRFMDILVALK